MNLRAYRMIKEKFAKTAFTGEGARLFGGRWSSKGFPLVYIAENLSLAVLEMLVGLEDTGLLSSYVIFEVEFEEKLVEVIKGTDLPKDWQLFPHPISTQKIGDRWLAEGRSAILSVPSSVIPAERNFLINPRHPDFQEITISTPFPIDIDPRLLRQVREE
jgi:RES domain-containing protein